MTTYRSRSARGAGFTLIEILVVIAIIGLLAGMTTTVMVSARRSVRNAVVATQMAQLSIALDEYKNKYGEYPPDMSDDQAVMRHIKKRWPRYDVRDVAEFRDHIVWGCQLSSAGFGYDTELYSIDDLNGQQVWDVRRYLSSLIFWLGGLPDENGKPSGFYANPKAPLGIGFDSNGNASPLRWPGKAQREKPLFDFELKNIGTFLTNDDGVDYPQDDADALFDSDLGAYRYSPAFVQGKFPIVYFRPSANATYSTKQGLYATDSDVSEYSAAVPYARSAEYDNNGNPVGADWYEAKRFQLIHPGVDGLFGPDESVESRQGLPTTKPKTDAYPEDMDNVANFATNSTVESECEDE